MDQLDIAIHQTAHVAPGGLEALARTMGISAQVLRNKVCPTTETHKLGVREALAMMEIANDDRILEVMAQQRGRTLGHIELPCATSIIRAVLSEDAEHGGIAKQINSALADGRLTEREKSDITRQIARTIDTLNALASSIVKSPTLLK